MPTTSFVGPALPATRTAGSYFASAHGADAIWGQVALAIFCPIGSRFMNRSFGCALSDELFGLMDSVGQKIAEYHVRVAIGRYVPAAQITDVSVKRTNSTTMQVSVAFTAAGTPDEVSRSISFTPAGIRF